MLGNNKKSGEEDRDNEEGSENRPRESQEEVENVIPLPIFY